jgi:hypothetical protein
MEIRQLDLFEEYSEEQLLKEEVALLKSEIGNLRRGIFARFGVMNEEFHEMKEDLNIMRKIIGKMDEVYKEKEVI